MGKLKLNRARRAMSSAQASECCDPCDDSHHQDEHYVELFDWCSTYLPFNKSSSSHNNINNNDLHRLEDVDDDDDHEDISSVNMPTSSRNSLPVPNLCDHSTSSSSTSTLPPSSCQQSSRMSSSSSSSPRQHLLVCFLLVITLLTTSTLSFPNCPSSNQICRLIRKTCHDRSSPMSMPSFGAGDNATECECVTIHEGGWEITCNDPTATTEATNKEFDSEDYMPAFNLLQPLFFVRYELGRQVKITCDTGTPHFKSALFQGEH